MYSLSLIQLPKSKPRVKILSTYPAFLCDMCEVRSGRRNDAEKAQYIPTNTLFLITFAGLLATLSSSPHRVFVGKVVEGLGSSLHFVCFVYFVVHISLRTLRPCASALKHLQHLHGHNLCALCVLCGYQSTRQQFATSTASLHPPYLPIDYPPIPQPLPKVPAEAGDAQFALFAAKQLYLSPYHSARAQPDAISGTNHRASSDGSRQRPALTLSPWSDVK